MRNVYNPLYRISGWFSPLLKAPGWFDRSAVVDAATVVIVGAATESPDTATGQLATVVAFNGAATEAADTATGTINIGTVFNVAATEAPDTAAGQITVIPAGVVSINIAATENPDTAVAQIVTPSPKPPPLPSGGGYSGFYVPHRHVRQPIVVTMRASESPDCAAGRIEVLPHAVVVTKVSITYPDNMPPMDEETIERNNALLLGIPFE